MRRLFSGFCGIAVIGLSIYSCIISRSFQIFGIPIIVSFIIGVLGAVAGASFKRHQTFWYVIALIGLLGCGALICATVVRGLIYDYKLAIGILACGLAGCIAESL